MAVNVFDSHVNGILNGLKTTIQKTVNFTKV